MSEISKKIILFENSSIHERYLFMLQFFAKLPRFGPKVVTLVLLFHRGIIQLFRLGVHERRRGGVRSQVRNLQVPGLRCNMLDKLRLQRGMGHFSLLSEVNSH